MSNGTWLGLGASARRILALVAGVAQLLLLSAPLADLPERGSGVLTVAPGIATPDSPSIAPQHPATQQHNATTCPACIAQTLHAQASAVLRLPTVVVSERAPVEIRRAAPPHHDPPAAHLSRAPPVVS
jgi:hypothetical protein